MTTFYIEPFPSDPDLEVGGYLTVERADGRAVWRQRFVVACKSTVVAEHPWYLLRPVDIFHEATTKEKE